MMELSFIETSKPAQFNSAVWKDEYSELITVHNSLRQKKDFL